MKFPTELRAKTLTDLRYVVVGGGIIGIATARHLLHRGVRHVTLLEAQTSLSTQQTGHNSGVVHAGLYYKPNSLKARLCRQGMRATYDYCQQRNIPYKTVGKLVVALYPSQLRQLHTLYRNAVNNGVPDVALLTSSKQIKQIEPCCAGIAAIHSPHTAIVDWRQVALHLADDVRLLGGTILLSAKAVGLSLPLLSSTSPLSLRVVRDNQSSTTLQADRIITCAGVEADRVAQDLYGSPTPAIIPVRGEYLRLSKNPTVKPATNIYPVPPQPSANKASPPFLGVHYTPTLSANNDILIGPNAVPALSRHGTRLHHINLRDIATMLKYTGFWHLAAKHGSFAMSEIFKSLSVSAAIRDAIPYVPDLRPCDFHRRDPTLAGIRAQAVAPDGTLIDDFVFELVAQNRVLHVRNAPSPGATAALAFAELLVERSLAQVP